MWIGCIDRLGWMDMTIDGIYWGGKIGCIGRTEKGDYICCVRSKKKVFSCFERGWVELREEKIGSCLERGWIELGEEKRV